MAVLDIATYFCYSLLIIFLFYAVPWIYGYIRNEYYFSKFKIGPPALPYPLGNLLELLHTDEKLLGVIREYSRKYHPIFKVVCGPLSTLNLTGPEEIEDCISTTKNLTKSKAYDLFKRWLGTGLLISTGSKWHSRRRILTPAFHFKILQKFVQVFNSETGKLVSRYVDQCEDKQGVVLDVTKSITEFALMSITETSMGTKLDLTNNEHKEYRDSIHKMGQHVVERFVIPWKWINWIYYNFVKKGFEELRVIEVLQKFTRKMIDEKSKNFVPFDMATEDSYVKRKTMPLIDVLLNAKYTDSSIDDDGIQEEVDTFVFEGHDTTSAAICFALMLLANNPLEQNLAFEEIEEVLGTSNKNPTFDQLNQLKYLERCIKETLRLYPSVHFIARLLTEDWTTKSGYTFGKGSVVNIHIFDLHRNPELYENPTKFDPDRFLPENVQKRHPFAYLPFSAGPRNCIGQRYAILEMKSVLCGILQSFKLEPIDTPESVIIVPHLVLKPKNGIKVKFVPRI